MQRITPGGLKPAPVYRGKALPSIGNRRNPPAALERAGASTMSRSDSLTDQKRPSTQGERRLGRPSFGDAVLAFSSANQTSGGTASTVEPPSSPACSVAGRLTVAVQAALGLEDEEVDSPARKNMRHACKGLVQRITLDPHTIG